MNRLILISAVCMQFGWICGAPNPEGVGAYAYQDSDGNRYGGTYGLKDGDDQPNHGNFNPVPFGPDFDDFFPEYFRNFENILQEVELTYPISHVQPLPPLKPLPPLRPLWFHPLRITPLFPPLPLQPLRPLHLPLFHPLQLLAFNPLQIFQPQPSPESRTIKPLPLITPLQPLRPLPLLKPLHLLPTLAPFQPLQVSSFHSWNLFPSQQYRTLAPLRPLQPLRPLLPLKPLQPLWFHPLRATPPLPTLHTLRPLQSLRPLHLPLFHPLQLLAFNPLQIFQPQPLPESRTVKPLPLLPPLQPLRPLPPLKPLHPLPTLVPLQPLQVSQERYRTLAPLRPLQPLRPLLPLSTVQLLSSPLLPLKPFLPLRPLPLQPLPSLLPFQPLQLSPFHPWRLFPQQLPLRIEVFKSNKEYQKKALESAKKAYDVTSNQAGFMNFDFSRFPFNGGFGNFGMPNFGPQNYGQFGGPNSAYASGSAMPGYSHQVAAINPGNPSQPNVDIKNRFAEDGNSGNGGYMSVSSTSYATSSNVNGQEQAHRGAETVVNKNGVVHRYKVEN